MHLSFMNIAICKHAAYARPVYFYVKSQREFLRRISHLLLATSYDGIGNYTELICVLSVAATDSLLAIELARSSSECRDQLVFRANQFRIKRIRISPPLAVLSPT
jgi:hypothetical protein